MGTDMTLQCSCGKLKGRVLDVEPAHGTHVECHCKDCQSFARHLGQAAVLGLRGETDIFQTSIWRVSIDQGADQLRCLKLSPKGNFRWYADCCKTPIANTMASGKLNFVGLLGITLDKPDPDTLGPVLCRYGSESATGEGSELKNFGVSIVARRMISRAIKARFRKGTTGAPFFTATGQPVSAPHMLTLAERNKARGA